MYNEIRNLLDVERRDDPIGPVKLDACLLFRDVNAALARVKYMRKQANLCRVGSDVGRHRRRWLQPHRNVGGRVQEFQVLVPSAPRQRKQRDKGKVPASPRVETSRIGLLLTSQRDAASASPRPDTKKLHPQASRKLRGTSRPKTAPLPQGSGNRSRRQVLSNLSEQQLQLHTAKNETVRLPRPSTSSSTMGTNSMMAWKLRQCNRAHLEVQSNRTASVLRSALVR